MSNISALNKIELTKKDRQESIFEQHRSLVQAFNASNYKEFFRDLRYFIEDLSMLMILEILGEEEGNDVLNERKSIRRKSKNKYIIENENPNLEGTELESGFQSLDCISANQNLTVRDKRILWTEKMKSEYQKGLEKIDQSIPSSSAAEEYICLDDEDITFDFKGKERILCVYRSFMYKDQTNEKKTDQTITRELNCWQDVMCRFYDVSSGYAHPSVIKFDDGKDMSYAAVSFINMYLDFIVQKEILPDISFIKKLRESSFVLPIITGYEVKETDLDEDQLKVINWHGERPMLVEGCAGSGKSIIATKCAINLAREKKGESVIIFTKTSISADFMKSLLKQADADVKVYNSFTESIKADYIIVDGIEDFKLEEVLKFTEIGKSFLFIGDDEQQIYLDSYTDVYSNIIKILREKFNGNDNPKLIEVFLKNNYRLPREIGVFRDCLDTIAEELKHDSMYDYMYDNTYDKGIETNPGKYKNSKGNVYMLKYNSKAECYNAISEILRKEKKESKKRTGILLYSNSQLIEVLNTLKRTNKDISFQSTYFETYEDENGKLRKRRITNYNLEANNKNTAEEPLVLTYHNSKGLQFGSVILPMLEDNDMKYKKALRVAMTRTLGNLYILYIGSLQNEFKKIPDTYYLTKLK